MMGAPLPAGYEPPLGYVDALDHEIDVELDEAGVDDDGECEMCTGSGRVRVPFGSTSYAEVCPSCGGQGSLVLRCYECDEVITGELLRNPEEVAWVGEGRARAWCSADCMEASSEAYWMQVWSAA